MPRLARMVCAQLPHHTIQRGNRREDIFLTDSASPSGLAKGVRREVQGGYPHVLSDDQSHPYRRRPSDPRFQRSCHVLRQDAVARKMIGTLNPSI